MVNCRKCGSGDNLIKNKFKREGLESLCKSCSIDISKSKHNKDIFKKWYQENKKDLIKRISENRDKKRTTPKRTKLSESERIIRKKESYKRAEEMKDQMWKMYENGV